MNTNKEYLSAFIVFILLSALFTSPLWLFQYNVEVISESYIRVESIEKIDNDTMIPNSNGGMTYYPDTDWRIYTFDGDVFVDPIDSDPSVNDVYKKTEMIRKSHFIFNPEKVLKETEIVEYKRLTD